MSNDGADAKRTKVLGENRVKQQEGGRSESRG